MARVTSKMAPNNNEYFSINAIFLNLVAIRKPTEAAMKVKMKIEIIISKFDVFSTSGVIPIINASMLVSILIFHKPSNENESSSSPWKNSNSILRPSIKNTKKLICKLMPISILPLNTIYKINLPIANNPACTIAKVSALEKYGSKFVDRYANPNDSDSINVSILKAKPSVII